MAFVSHDLADYYALVTKLQHYQHWDLEYIDNMVPWQFNIYVNNIIQFLKEEEEQRKLEEQRREDAKFAY